nr:hypothetical protein Iba_chr05dCG10980 [Ipomoea batatas]
MKKIKAPSSTAVDEEDKGDEFEAVRERSTSTAGQRWFAPETTVERSIWKGPDGEDAELEKGKSPMEEIVPPSLIVSRVPHLTKGTNAAVTDSMIPAGNGAVGASKEITIYDQKRKLGVLMLMFYARCASPIRNLRYTSSCNVLIRPDYGIISKYGIVGMSCFGITKDGHMGGDEKDYAFE